MRLAVAGADLACSFIMTLIIVAFIVDGAPKKRSNISFFVNILMVLFFSFVDGVSYLVEPMHIPYRSEFALNVMSFVGTDYIVVAFSDYLWSLVNEKNNISYKPIYFVTSIAFIDIVVIMVGSINKKLFYFGDAGIEYGSWYGYTGVVQVIAIVYMLIFLLKYRDVIDKIAFYIALTYFILITANATVEIIWPEAAFTYPTMGTVILLTYVYIQARDARNFRLKETVMKQMLSNDSLTGLKNRVSFINRIESINPRDRVWSVFCNVNKLKEANERGGHTAGDALLCRFGEILSEIFNKDDVYRINGNEFVVLCVNPTGTNINDLISLLEKTISENNDIASFGSWQGIGINIDKIISISEDRMYKDKLRYNENAKNLK